MEDFKIQEGSCTARFAQLYQQDEPLFPEEEKNEGINIFRELSMNQAKCLVNLKREQQNQDYLFKDNLALQLPSYFLNDYANTHDQVQETSESVSHYDINFTFVKEMLSVLDEFCINKIKLNPQEKALKEEQETWLLIETLIQLETQYFAALRNNEIVDGTKIRQPNWKPKIKFNQESQEEGFIIREKDFIFGKEDNRAVLSVGTKFNVKTPLQMVSELTAESPRVLFPFMISKWLEKIYVFDEQNYALKKLDPPDLSNKQGPSNDYNIKNQAIAPLELLDSTAEQDNYYLPLYQSVFHNLRAGRKLELQQDLMMLDEQEIYDEIEAMLPVHDFLFGDVNQQPRFIGPDNILAQESLDRLNPAYNAPFLFDITLDFMHTHEEFTQFYSSHSELRNESKLNRRFKKEVGFIEWRLTHEELLQNAKEGQGLLNKQADKWYKAMYGAIVGYMPAVEELEGLSWHDLLWIYERASYYINLRTEFTQRDLKLLKLSEEPYQEEKVNTQLHYSMISVRKATRLFNPHLDLIEDMSSWFSLQQTEAIDALQIQKSKSSRMEEPTPYNYIQFELIKSAYEAIVKGKTTPLVYANIYSKIQKILDHKGVASRAGRDSQFKQFVRVLAHFSIYMLLKYRLPRKCVKTHDLVIANYIELLIETSTSADDEALISIIPGYFRFTVNKEGTFPLRLKFLLLFKESKSRTKKLQMTLISEDLSQDQAQILISDLMDTLQQKSKNSLDWKFNILQYLLQIEIALSQNKLDQCDALLHNMDYRDEFKSRCNQIQKSILTKYELCHRVLAQVDHWLMSKDAEYYHQLNQQFREGRPPREVKSNKESERICDIIETFILPNFDSPECASESTFVFDDPQMQIVEPRTVVEVVLSKLGNILINILRFTGRYNKLDDVYVKIHKIQSEEKCPVCFGKWVQLYKEYFIKNLDKKVLGYLHKQKGLSLTCALSKEPY